MAAAATPAQRKSTASGSIRARIQEVSIQAPGKNIVLLNVYGIPDDGNPDTKTDAIALFKEASKAFTFHREKGKEVFCMGDFNWVPDSQIKSESPQILPGTRVNCGLG